MEKLAGKELRLMSRISHPSDSHQLSDGLFNVCERHDKGRSQTR